MHEPTAGEHAATPPTTSQDVIYMRRCLELARRALAAGDVPVGALIVREGHVIGEGYERTRACLDPAAHAEIEAIRDACRTLGSLDLSGATLYTTVEPCVLCAYGVRQTRIRRVVFGVRAGALGGASGPYPLLTDTASTAHAAPPVVQEGVLAEQCRRLLEERRP
ncbi:MAG TPA: nucleoside deaminase [Gemmatimonadaceae bacterium]|nr:nucleoside deaminase [Gemmatimonadaceae bacterium]